MTLTLASDATRPHSPSRRNRPYTQEEDDVIRQMRAAHHTLSEIAAALGRPESGIKCRARIVSPVRFLPGPHRPVVTGTCPRCGILLSVAPAATGDVCGWCERERRG